MKKFAVIRPSFLFSKKFSRNILINKIKVTRFFARHYILAYAVTAKKMIVHN
jgi:hypothetical protein